MNYSMNDIYPMSSQYLSTTNQTIEDDIKIDDSVATDSDNQKFKVNKTMIFGAILLLVVINVIVSFIE
jgi:hypothetical protein